MTTQEKTAAIREIVANQQDNNAALKAAKLPEGLEPYAIEAMNEAFKADLGTVFASKKT